MKLISMLLHPGQGGGDRICMIDGDRSFTRAQAAAAVGRLIEDLREQGVAPGQRVLAVLDHDPQGVFFLAAASALGLHLLMPYNLQAAALSEWLNIARTAKPDCVVYLKRDTAPAAALREAGLRVVEPASVAAGDGACERQPVVIDAIEPVANFVVLFTSGTTGAPKAISIAEALVCRRIVSVSSRLKFDSSARVFMSGLLNNTTGVIFSFGALLHDATLIFPQGRQIESWPQQVAASKASHIMLRPLAMKQFVAGAVVDAVDLSCLRVVAYGATAMPRQLLEEGRRLMRCDWVQGYGLSETYGPFCWLDEEAHRQQRYRHQLYCVGKPDTTVEVQIRPLEGHPAGVGEVMLRGDALMEGYYDVRTGELRAPGEWMATGDLGAWSEAGELVLKGRTDSTVMSRNGHRIYPEEVESVLAEVPGVDDAVLLGVEGGTTLQVSPVACIHGALSRRDREEIRSTVTAALSRSLSREKWPDWIFASAQPFPKSGNDKLLKAEIRRLIAADALIEV